MEPSSVRHIVSLNWALRIRRSKGVSCILQKLCTVFHIYRYIWLNVKNNPGRVVFYGTLERSPKSFFELGNQDK